MNIIANGNGLCIGYADDGTPMQIDHSGEWVEAVEACLFTDEKGEEYKCCGDAWIKTDPNSMRRASARDEWCQANEGTFWE